MTLKLFTRTPWGHNYNNSLVMITPGGEHYSIREYRLRCGEYIGEFPPNFHTVFVQEYPVVNTETIYIRIYIYLCKQSWEQFPLSVDLFMNGTTLIFIFKMST
jgi:hypothetical protein